MTVYKVKHVEHIRTDAAGSAYFRVNTSDSRFNQVIWKWLRSRYHESQWDVTANQFENTPEQRWFPYLLRMPKEAAIMAKLEGIFDYPNWKAGTHEGMGATTGWLSP